MSEVALKRIVQHCLLYPGNNCYGYIINNDKVVPVSHAPLLPPFNSIFYDDISKESIEAMYVSSTNSQIPTPFITFAQQKSITTIYVISLYNTLKRIQKFTFKSNNKWESQIIECDLKGVIADTSIIEFESIYEQTF